MKDSLIDIASSQALACANLSDVFTKIKTNLILFLVKLNSVSPTIIANMLMIAH